MNELRSRDAISLNQHSKLVIIHLAALSSSCVDPRLERIEQTGVSHDRRPLLDQANQEMSV